jgi:hypothetical protein
VKVHAEVFFDVVIPRDAQLPSRAMRSCDVLVQCMSTCRTDRRRRDTDYAQLNDFSSRTLAYFNTNYLVYINLLPLIRTAICSTTSTSSEIIVTTY